MRALTSIALFLLGASASSFAQDKDDRTVWAYPGGWFSTKDGKCWIELSYNIYKDNEGKPIEFKEVKRTKESIDLYDAKRKVTVRLSAAKMEWRQDGKDEWNFLLQGKWTKWGK